MDFDLGQLDLGHVFMIGLTVLATAVAVYIVVSRRRREARDLATLKKAEEENRHIPPTLYPKINPDICIGSLSCLKACPEGDILGVVNGAARLIEATHCIGHGRCAAECPVDAIQLVVGTSQRGVDLPHVSEFFESSRPGVHVVGELGGMGLIKNAVIQGVQAAHYFKREIKQPSQQKDLLDVLVVGAGPAGLACAVTLQAHGLSCHVMEQDTVGGTIAHYPRQKVVMTEAVDLPGFGRIGKQILSKEELLEHWKKAITKSGVKIHTGVKVTAVDGDDGSFTVETSKGKVKAKKVVLAIGRRGSPRKLNVPGEETEKVAYRLIDPEQYMGCKVAVVGGGDSALEASIQLAEQSDAEVTHIHRSDDFGKCRDANRRKIKALFDAKKVRPILRSSIKEIRPDEIVIDADGGDPVVIANDFVLVCAGGELPVQFLNAVGIDVKRHWADRIGDSSFNENPAAKAPARMRSAKGEAKRRQQNRMWIWLTIIGVLIISALTVFGWDYYRLSQLQRLRSPLHALLKPSGPWGHGLGVVATAVLLTNFLYVVRKHWKKMMQVGTIRGWLDFHSFIGLVAPVVIAFHAAFQSKNTLATSTAASLAVVVVTGVIGRFIFGLVPSHNGKAIDLADLLGRWERLKDRVKPIVDRLRNPAPVAALLATATAPAVGGSLMVFMAKVPVESMRAWRKVKSTAPLFPDAEDYADFHDAFWHLWWLRAAVTFYKSLKRLMGAWRVLHVVLAIFLAVMISAHVAVEVYLGYKWIFR